MLRPCVCDNTVIGGPLVKERDCPACWLYHNNPKSRQAWDRTAPEPGQLHPSTIEPMSTPTHGPGTELKLLLAELGFVDVSGCGCSSCAAEMDVLGPIGCMTKLEHITDHLRKQAETVGWAAKILAGVRALRMGFVLSLSDPYGDLVKEAVRRAVKKAASAKIP